MSDEIFDRPNRATGPREVWEREESGRTFKVYAGDDGALCFLCEGSRCGRGPHISWVTQATTRRYRIRTIPDEPWPPRTREEKRYWPLALRDKQGFSIPAGWYTRSSRDFHNNEWGGIEWCERDCKIDENGKVVGVIHFKEG